MYPDLEVLGWLEYMLQHIFLGGPHTATLLSLWTPLLPSSWTLPPDANDSQTLSPSQRLCWPPDPFARYLSDASSWTFGRDPKLTVAQTEPVFSLSTLHWESQPSFGLFCESVRDLPKPLAGHSLGSYPLWRCALVSVALLLTRLPTCLWTAGGLSFCLPTSSGQAGIWHHRHPMDVCWMSENEPSGRWAWLGFPGMEISAYGLRFSFSKCSWFPVAIKESQVISAISSNSWYIINILWGDHCCNLQRFWKDGHNCNYMWAHGVPLLSLPTEDDGPALGSVPSALEISLSPSFWPPCSLPQHLWLLVWNPYIQGLV